MVCETSPAKQPKATVVGAGVIGLTTAVLLQRNGFRVTVVARDFPGVLSIVSTPPPHPAPPSLLRSVISRKPLRLLFPYGGQSPEGDERAEAGGTAEGMLMKRVSRHPPLAPLSAVEYTSPWAGAHWRSMADADDLRLQGSL
ncbi:MAG: hypothetical protein BJ554DRAFT_5617 [Olpidium bornovanus]|uniref:FAD dependent oxidoreductase domain-containing protein n=1 Tax=Olpidium bornovanus TaxID=278681 RepID=A0A8H7ZYX4_9FUNG|nr:MAG: hypothetical protein BJ554DRAFT_5617 [Olpidium bornovanus]